MEGRMTCVHTLICSSATIIWNVKWVCNHTAQLRLRPGYAYTINELSVQSIRFWPRGCEMSALLCLGCGKDKALSASDRKSASSSICKRSSQCCVWESASWRRQRWEVTPFFWWSHSVESVFRAMRGFPSPTRQNLCKAIESQEAQQLQRKRLRAEMGDTSYVNNLPSYQQGSRDSPSVSVWITLAVLSFLINLSCRLVITLQF